MEHLIKEKLHNMFHGYESRFYEAIEKFASSFTAKYGISPSTAISVILGFVCLGMFLKRRLGSKHTPFLKRSISLSELLSGELALRRWNDYNVAHQVPETLDRNDLVLKGLLEEEHLDLMKLQSTVAKLEISGNEDKAIPILKDAKKRCAGKPHQAYEIDMLLVEMLIYKGEFKEALKCDCLEHEIEVDGRRPLFKAVIYGLLENWGEAEKHWKEFVTVREFIKARDRGVLHHEFVDNITDFRIFKDKVEALRSKILKKYRI